MFSRLLAFVVSLASLIVLGLAFWPQLLGWQREAPWAFAVSARGLVAVLAMVIVVVFAFLGRFGRPVRRVLMAAGSWLVVFALASGTLLYFRGLGTAMPAVTSDSVRVLAWNTNGDAPAPAEIARLIIDQSADVVSLPETTSDTAKAVVRILGQAGRDFQSFAVAKDETYKAHSTVLLVNRSLGEYRLDTSAPQTALAPTLVARPSGDGPTLVATHAMAPGPVAMPLWRSDLDIVAKLCQGPDVIVAGDLNATVDTMQGLGPQNIGDCRDAALLTRGAAVGTWPTWLPPLLGAPIDHVLATTTWRVDGFQVIMLDAGAGSDHRPVVAQLSRVAR